MTTDEYDRLLEQIGYARKDVEAAMTKLATYQNRLDDLLSRLGREDHRTAREALASMHSASRKLVVGE